MPPWDEKGEGVIAIVIAVYGLGFVYLISDAEQKSEFPILLAVLAGALLIGFGLIMALNAWEGRTRKT